MCCRSRAPGAIVSASWLVRSASSVYHPWYAAPGRFLLLLVVCGALAPWHLTRLAWLLPEPGRYVRRPESVWALVLPFWCGLAGALEWVAPAASHIWSLPLLTAGALLAVVPLARPGLVRAVSAAVLAMTLVLFLPDGLVLFHFMVAVLGRLPIVTPVWALPSLVAVIGLMIAPPAVAAAIGLVRGRTGHGVVGGVLLAGFALTLGLSYAARPYTTDRPQRRSVLYVNDEVTRQAWWEVAGNEPGLDLTLPGPEAARWALVDRASRVPSSVPVRGAFGAFRFRGPATAATPPAEVVARVTTATDVADHVDYEVVVSPKTEGLTASVVLPPGLVPARATPSGIQPQDRWLSTYAAVPATGLSFRLRFPVQASASLSGIAVVIASPTLPGGAGRTLPAWLPQDVTTWSPDARWIVAPAAAVEPPAAPVELPAAPVPPASLR